MKAATRAIIKWDYLVIFVTIAVCGFMIFTHLTTLEIRKWDEVRNAINAVEMAQEGFSVVTTYNWKPDHWNTKPPLLIWIQTFCIKLFGINEFAIRLPSALAALSFLGIFFWIKRRLNASLFFWVIVCFVFITIPQTLHNHSFRFGDYDGLLCLFMFLSAMHFFFYVEKFSKSNLFWLFLFLQLAILTKSIAALLFLPGMLFYAFHQRAVLRILKEKYFWLGVIALIAITCSYYIVRNHIDPTYWSYVVQNELGGRYLEVVEGHGGSWYSYLSYLYYKGLKFYILLVPLSIGLLFYLKAHNKLLVYSLYVLLSYLAIISASATRISWYLLPMMPFFAVLIALALEALWKQSEKSNRYRAVLLLLCIPLIGIPLNSKLKFLIYTKNDPSEMNLYKTANFIRAHLDDQQILEELTLFLSDDVAIERFYVEAYEKEGGIIYFKKIEDMKSGDRVFVSNLDQERKLSSRFQLLLDYEEAEVQIYRVLKLLD